MKTIITTEHETEAKRLLHASGLCHVLYEIREAMIRDKKYNGGKKTTEQWLTELCQIMQDAHIDLDEIWS